MLAMLMSSIVCLKFAADGHVNFKEGLTYFLVAAGRSLCTLEPPMFIHHKYPLTHALSVQGYRMLQKNLIRQSHLLAINMNMKYEQCCTLATCHTYVRTYTTHTHTHTHKIAHTCTHTQSCHLAEVYNDRITLAAPGSGSWLKCRPLSLHGPEAARQLLSSPSCSLADVIRKSWKAAKAHRKEQVGEIVRVYVLPYCFLCCYLGSEYGCAVVHAKILCASQR